jgi:hypothetical protein
MGNIIKIVFTLPPATVKVKGGNDFKVNILSGEYSSAKAVRLTQKLIWGAPSVPLVGQPVFEYLRHIPIVITGVAILCNMTIVRNAGIIRECLLPP